MAIGQGAFTATPLQAAAAHATIARGGEYLSPILSLEGAPTQVRRKLPISPEDIQAVHEGLCQVISEPGGTAYRYWSGGLALDVVVCGKTGTAQAPPRRIDSNKNGRIDSEDQIVEEGDHSWFAGFAPRQKPKIALAVLLEYGGSGGKFAAPIGKQVVRICKEFGYLEN